MVRIEHPQGMIVIDLDVDLADGRQELRRAALIRTARRIYEGNVLVPSKIWAGQKQAQPAKALA